MLIHFREELLKLRLSNPARLNKISGVFHQRLCRRERLN
jgi:hypothetical protein